MCGSKGTTIDSLMKLSVDHSDLLAAKIVRNMSSHDDTVDVFLLVSQTHCFYDVKM